MRSRIARSVPVVPPRPREGMSEDHRKMIKLLCCLVCGRCAPSDPHHLQRGLPPDQRGMARKAADKYLIPLCRACHDGHGPDDEAWLAERGVMGRDIAAALWGARGDLEAMHRIVVRNLISRGKLGVLVDG